MARHETYANGYGMLLKGVYEANSKSLAAANRGWTVFNGPFAHYPDHRFIIYLVCRAQMKRDDILAYDVCFWSEALRRGRQPSNDILSLRLQAVVVISSVCNYRGLAFVGYSIALVLLKIPYLILGLPCSFSVLLQSRSLRY